MRSVPLHDGRLDLERGVIVRGDRTHSLSATEARLLDHLVQHPERAWSRDELQVEVWGYRPGIPSRTVFTTVGRLRRKLEEDPSAPRHLVTDPEGGYRFVLPDGTRTAAHSTPTLPQPATPFVGRAEELARCQALLAATPGVLTLFGPGGIGKTRLALALAERADAAVFVALDPVRDPDDLHGAVADALGVVASGPEPLSLLADVLARNHPLLVLDNAEHLVSATASLVDALAARCPDLRIVVTSRVRLRLRREVTVEVAPLTLADTAEELDASDAGRLLLESAARARPGWVPDPAQRTTLLRICRQVGGSPLALELAGAWLRLLEPEEIARELETSLDLLESTLRDVPERHRSLRGTLEASWRLLDPHTAEALSRLSVFRAPFTRATAAAVAGAGLLQLGQLVDSSMVRRAGGRFELHPLIRQLADEKLDDDARRALHAEHAAWFLDHLSDAFAAWEDSDVNADALRAPLLDELTEVSAAYEWALESRDLDWLDRAALPFVRTLELAGRYRESGRLLQATIELCDAMEPSPQRDRVLGLSLASIAGLGVRREVRTEEAVQLIEPFGGVALALCLTHAAIGALMVGDWERAVAWSNRAVELASAGPVWMRGFATAVAGVTHMTAGNHAQARALLDEAVAIGARHDSQMHARPLVHRGELALLLGEPDARAQLEAAVDSCRRHQDQSFEVLALSRLGEACAAVGADPLDAWTEALEIFLAHRVPAFWTNRAVLGLARLLIGTPHEELAWAALAWLGRMPSMAQTWEEAESILSRAKQEDPARVAQAVARGERMSGEQLAMALLAVDPEELRASPANS